MKKNILEESLGECPLCKREMIKGVRTSKHHLVPKSEKGKETLYLHDICHQKIHSVFTEKELAKEYNNVDALLTNLEIQKFVQWVKNKPVDFYDSNRDTNNRSKKRKNTK